MAHLEEDDHFVFDLNGLVSDNRNFRTVVSSTDQMQMTIMNFKEGVEVGSHKHPTATQFVHVQEGEGILILGRDRMRYKLTPGAAVMIPRNTWHNIIATTHLKLYALYSPPEYREDQLEGIKKIKD